MQEMKWKFVVLTLYWVSISIFPIQLADYITGTPHYLCMLDKWEHTIIKSWINITKLYLQPSLPFFVDILII
jgi:hypothetical protein